jgi:hypothetical protein
MQNMHLMFAEQIDIMSISICLQLAWYELYKRSLTAYCKTLKQTLILDINWG